MEFFEVVKNRYSCKKFGGKPVEKEKLDRVLEAGRLAPTAKNAQPQKITVVTSEKLLLALDKCTPCRYGAPVVIAVAYDKNNVYTYPGGKYNAGAEDATIVATHMMLAAYDAGLDSCWLNCFDPDETAKALNLPDDEQLVMLLDVGYAADGAGPLENHSKRKPLEATVKYL
ncbi:MAG: nitroreductase family protein [Clostridiales bacterium]|nr:nitroreductase family protein [Clostridiales bacterium]